MQSTAGIRHTSGNVYKSQIRGHIKAGRTRAATALLEKVVAEQPNDFEALQNLGALHARQERIEEARDLLQRALTLAPDLPEANHNLGVILSKFGDMEAAVDYVKRAVELAPQYGEAYHTLANLTEGAEGTEYVLQIEKALSDKNLDDHSKRYLNFSAGHFLHRLKRYDEAFRHYAAGNAARNAAYDPAIPERNLKAARNAFTSELFAKANTERPGRHVFIVGLPRSGTTLVEQILASHPQVAAAGEMPDIPAIAHSLRKYAKNGGSYPNCLASLPAEAFAGMARSYHTRIREVTGEADVYVDKNPYNFVYLGLVYLLFPDATIIHCRRHPLDTALSCFMHNFTTGNEFSFSLQTIGHYFRYYERTMAHWEGNLPSLVHHADHRSMVIDLEASTRRLLDVIGLRWHESCAQFYENRRVVHTASSLQVHRPLTGEGIDRWRRYSSHLGPLIDAMWPAGIAT